MTKVAMLLEISEDLDCGDGEDKGFRCGCFVPEEKKMSTMRDGLRWHAALGIFR